MVESRNGDTYRPRQVKRRVVETATENEDGWWCRTTKGSSPYWQGQRGERCRDRKESNYKLQTASSLHSMGTACRVRTRTPVSVVTHVAEHIRITRTFRRCCIRGVGRLASMQLVWRSSNRRALFIRWRSVWRWIRGRRSYTHLVRILRHL